MAASIRLSPEIEQRLDALAPRTGRSKAFYLRDAVERGLEGAEDYYLAADALARVRNGTEKTCSDAEIRRSLGLDD